MPCERVLQTQAYFDGELDAAAAPELEKHLETCADCAALLEQAESVRRLVREKGSYHRASDALRARVTEAASARGRVARRPWYRSVWSGAAGGAAATALAAALAFFVLLPPAAEPLIADVTNAHLRSLASAHLIDVESTDRHTVKPWLAVHADLSPPVADFGSQGFKLVGGRVDFLEGERAAVTVYRHGAHIVNVFAWANYNEPLPEFATRNGYHIVFWRAGNLTFCAVSDTSVDDILALAKLLKALSAPDGRE
ncbi:MAG: anti-sigma factor [Alphaproteobacteria bacterium]|nr:anti-sigma factor [Alphaproteobacteria bacterium]MBL6937438.1 anti-sigma factor [Alphaproteobacteria bacterium]MBL7098776.1 anti-sigma factor [Alphaproteobacteria bacterium]